MKKKNKKNTLVKMGLMSLALVIALPAAEEVGGGDDAFSKASSKSSSESTYILQKSVVSAAGFAQDITNAPATISIITPKELLEKPFFDIATAVSNIPGIDTETEWGSNGGRAISIRGLPSKYTLILLDGLRNDNSEPTSTEHFGFPQQASAFMPPAVAIDHIEVIRGPMSTLYDSDALGGIVNMILKQPNLRTPKISLNADTTYNFNDQLFGNTSNLNTYVSVPLVKDYFGISMRTHNTYREPWHVKARYHSEYGGVSYGDNKLYHPFHGYSPTKAEIHYVGGRAFYLINRHHQIYADTAFMLQKYDNTDETIGEHERFLTIMRNYRRNFVFNYAASYEAIKNNLSLQHNYSQSLLEWDRVNYRVGSKVDGDVNNCVKYADDCRPNAITAKDFIIEDKVIIYAIPKNKLSIGARYWDQNYLDETVSTSYLKTGIFSIFGETEYDIIDPLFLTVGLRYSYNSKFKSSFTPRAYLVYNAFENDYGALSLKGGVSTGYKAPYITDTIEKARITTFDGKKIAVGNSGLKPEKSINYEISLLYNYKVLDVGVTYYHNDFSDKILRVNVESKSGSDYDRCVSGWDLFGLAKDAGRCRTWVNTSDAHIDGVETYLAITDWYHFGLNINYTFTYSRTYKEKKNMDLVNTPPHQVNAKLSYDFSKGNGIFLQMTYRSKKPIISATSSFDGISDPGKKNFQPKRPDLEYFKDYVVFDLAGYFKLGKHLNLNIGIYNLLDKNFASPDSFVPISEKRTTASGATDPFLWSKDYTVIQEGRRIYASLNFDF